MKSKNPVIQQYPFIPFFNSLNKELPQWFPAPFDNIRKRAQSILKERKEKEIKYALQTINWIRTGMQYEISMKGIKEYLNQNIYLIDDYDNHEFISQLTPAQMLENELQKLNISEQKDFPDATRSDYLAVLALGLIGMVFEKSIEIKKGDIKRKSKEKLEDLTFTGTLAIYAMEAVCLAEQYLRTPSDKEIISREVKKLVKLKHKANAIKGNQPKYLIAELFLQFYNSKKFKKDIDAINEFYGLLTDIQKEKIPSDYVRFFRKALRGFRKK